MKKIKVEWVTDNPNQEKAFSAIGTAPDIEIRIDFSWTINSYYDCRIKINDTVHAELQLYYLNNIVEAQNICKYILNSLFLCYDEKQE